VVERPPQRLLSWAHRDGSGTVLLGVHRGALRIYTTTERDPADAGDSEDAAYELLVAVADTLRPSGPMRPVAFLRSGRTEDGELEWPGGRPAPRAAALTNN
jgi:hypothetical protein